MLKFNHSTGHALYLCLKYSHVQLLICSHSLTYGRTLCTHSHREAVAPAIGKLKGSK